MLGKLKKRKRRKKHGFLSRIKRKAVKVLQKRRAKKRHSLTVSDSVHPRRGKK